jgi:hypothetical protein
MDSALTVQTNGFGFSLCGEVVLDRGDPGNSVAVQCITNPSP